MLVALSRQTRACRGKHTFVATKDVFCHEKRVSVVTKHLSQQTLYLWRLSPTILPELGKITLIMEICKATTPRLKALDKHNIAYIMYIEMENVDINLTER